MDAFPTLPSTHLAHSSDHRASEKSDAISAELISRDDIDRLNLSPDFMADLINRQHFFIKDFRKTIALNHEGKNED